MAAAFSTNSDVFAPRGLQESGILRGDFFAALFLQAFLAQFLFGLEPVFPVFPGRLAFAFPDFVSPFSDLIVSDSHVSPPGGSIKKQIESRHESTIYRPFC